MEEHLTSLAQLKIVLACLLGVFLLVVLAISIWLVRTWLIVVGYLALGSAASGVIAVGAFPVVALLRYIRGGTFHALDSHGSYFKPHFGEIRALPPLEVARTKVVSANGKMQTTVEIAITTFGELITQEEIRPGMTDMILGFLENGEMVRGPWPRTFAIAGKGRSGKTRRAIFMIGQALLGGATITVCDPHATKRDSLTKELGALSSWLTFATTDEEIVSASEAFLTEMERRVSGDSNEAISDGVFKPRLIIYDEWSRLMTRMESEEGRDKIKEVVVATSQEFAGYDGFACLIGQSWTNDDCGGTAIRRALHAVFVHRLDTDYAKFLIKPAKWNKQTENLATGHCLYQDLDGLIQKLRMPHVPEKACAQIAELLLQGGIRPVGTALLAAPSAVCFPSSLPVTPPDLAEKSLEVPSESILEASSLPNRKRVSDHDFVEVLKEIGKRIRAGESTTEIRKSLGVTGGRTFQEVNAALNFLQECQLETEPSVL